jgi:hypothetical protein
LYNNLGGVDRAVGNRIVASKVYLGTDRAIFSNNTCELSTVSLDNRTSSGGYTNIMGNTFQNPHSSASAAIETTGSNIGHCTISNNYVTSADPGILIAGNGSYFITGNTAASFNDPLIQNTSSSAKLIVTNNTLKNSASLGVSNGGNIQVPANSNLSF